MIPVTDLQKFINESGGMYILIFVGYGYLKWRQSENPHIASAFNTFNLVYAVPILSVIVISEVDFINFNFKLFVADCLQKAIVVVLLVGWKLLFKGSLDQFITWFAVCTQPNVLFLGTPLFFNIYANSHLSAAELFAFQSLIWNNVLVIMYEYRAATAVVIRQKGNVKEIGGGVEQVGTHEQKQSSRATSIQPKLILINVLKKLVRLPATYATILGVAWAIVRHSFRVKFEMPADVSREVTSSSLTIGMLNMGLSLAAEPSIKPCGKMTACLTLFLRFIVGPIVMALASVAVGLRGYQLHTIVVQAASSQAIVASSLSTDYNVYPEILSFSTNFGIIVAAPVMLLLYRLFSLI